MSNQPEGIALVYCEGAFRTANGKTAHGLVRFTRRYHVLAVIDSECAGQDAGQILDGRACGIPVVQDIAAGLAMRTPDGKGATHLVVGLAPDGGRLPASAREQLLTAVGAGLNVDSGLHDYISEDPDLVNLATKVGVRLRDVRKPRPARDLHFFTGKIQEVTSARIAVLGTDSAVGKRTTAVKLVQGLNQLDLAAELIGTGQTAWMQGARYGIILDSLVNDFVSGEIEHIIWQAWNEIHPDCLVLEGQGSLMNPAYPGGFELLAAGRPHAVVLQHAPGRKEYDGFLGYPIEPLPVQIQAVELLSKRPVVAITVNHEGMTAEQTSRACEDITKQTGLPCYDVILHGHEALVQHLVQTLDLVRQP